MRLRLKKSSIEIWSNSKSSKRGKTQSNEHDPCQRKELLQKKDSDLIRRQRKSERNKKRRRKKRKRSMHQKKKLNWLKNLQSRELKKRGNETKRKIKC